MIKRIFKTLTSKIFFFILGITLVTGIGYISAAFDDAKTGGDNTLEKNDWNTLVSELDTRCGSRCAEEAPVAEVTGSDLTENNWNGMIDLIDETFKDCASNGEQNCYTSGSYFAGVKRDNITVDGDADGGTNEAWIVGGYYPRVVDSDTKKCICTDDQLSAENIKSGINLFGVTGNLTSPSNCTVNGQQNCVAASTFYAATQGANVTVDGNTDGVQKVIPQSYQPGSRVAICSDPDLVASNIKKDVWLFGVKGSLVTTSGLVASDIEVKKNGGIGLAPNQTVDCSCSAGKVILACGYGYSASTGTGYEYIQAQALAYNNLGSVAGTSETCIVGAQHTYPYKACVSVCANSY